ncbi:MAG TPA: hypothetical protein VGT03_12480 [Candidatus Acidoferrales bacterium]|nr:hypothetical protein [Candidatus Acidoferrales bacterium]
MARTTVDVAMRVNTMLLLVFLFASLSAGRTTPPVRHFDRVTKSAVPKDLLDSKYLCGDTYDNDETTESCEEDFKEFGKVWAGDVNDDGLKELVIYLGPTWSGSAGDSYLLLGKNANGWMSLLSQFDDWFTDEPRFDILPTAHHGYHDLRVSNDLCMKFDGTHYVFYDDADYHSLSPAFFDASRWREAEIFWAIRYRGRNDFQFTPQWYPSFRYRSSVNVQLDDPQYGLEWTALFKGGIWGVSGKKAFLLLPRPAYKGSERMEIVGEWLVIHGENDDVDKEPSVVARYNRRTHEMIVFSDNFPLPG